MSETQTMLCVDCKFQKNKARVSWSVVHADFSRQELVSCVQQGAAAYMQLGSQGQCIRCNFAANIATKVSSSHQVCTRVFCSMHRVQEGSALFMLRGAHTKCADCKFEDNQVTNGVRATVHSLHAVHGTEGLRGDGPSACRVSGQEGAVALSDSVFYGTNCTFEANKATSVR